MPFGRRRGLEWVCRVAIALWSASLARSKAAVRVEVVVDGSAHVFIPTVDELVTPVKTFGAARRFCNTHRVENPERCTELVGAHATAQHTRARSRDHSQEPSGLPTATGDPAATRQSAKRSREWVNATVG